MFTLKQMKKGFFIKSIQNYYYAVISRNQSQFALQYFDAALHV